MKSIKQFNQNDIIFLDNDNRGSIKDELEKMKNNKNGKSSKFLSSFNNDQENKISFYKNSISKIIYLQNLIRKCLAKKELNKLKNENVPINININIKK
jgi:hypothetical protein